MSLRSFCDRCGVDALSPSKRFKLENFELTAVFRCLESESPTENHVCDNCLADLMMSAVGTLGDSEIVLNYQDTVRAAAKADILRKECEQLRNEKAELLKRLNQADDTRVDLMKKLLASQENVDLLTVEARKAKIDAEEHVRRAEAERNQRKLDEKQDPEYVDAVKRREQRRASGK